VVLGTVGYMSPEQVRGRPLDHRTDLFTFGAILYEMLSGKRAFKGDTAADTITAILKDDPPELSQSAAGNISPTVERIVRHCLEKDPEQRFQSARDLLFDLELLSGATTATIRALAAPRSRRKMWMAAAALLLAVMVGLGLALMLRPHGAPLPSYHQLTFRRGTVWSARFTSDGHTIVYGAAWGGAPTDIFSARAESTESRSLGMANAQLLAVSSSGELAVLLNSQVQNFFSRGTLARVPLGGGAPREVLDDVAQADWSPDGQNLAVVRYVDHKLRLEYPIGHTLYETDGAVARPRVSPDGQKVAFLEQPSQLDTRGWVAVIDVKTGAKTRLSGEWTDEQGLSWSPQGDEVWFTASKAGEAHALYAVSLDGRERVVSRAPTALMLHDTSRDGNVLLTAYHSSTPIIGLAPGATAERDLSWIDDVGLYDLSRDGKTFLFQYWGEGSGPNYASYLRKTDGSPAKRLGDGAGITISPDGKWVVAVMNTPPQTVLLPTGAGQIRKLDRAGIESYGADHWFPDSQQVIFTGFEPGHSPRTYAQDIVGGKPRPLTPEGITGNLVSPDGKVILVRNREGRFSLFSLTGGPSRPVHGLTLQDRVAGWSADGRWLYAYPAEQLPVQIYRIDLFTGRRETLREIRPFDAAGILNYPNVLLSADGRSYVYQLQRHLSVLYLAEHLAR
jgi:Tol biopolymer transport system component